MIDFEQLKKMDIEVLPGNPTKEELRAFSEFLKAHKAKQSENTKRLASARSAASHRKQAK